MILGILIAGATLSLCTLSLFLLLAMRNDFYLICRIFLVFVLVHFLHVIACEVFFNTQELRFADWAAPYGLLYGPFLLWAQQASEGKIKNKRKMLLHGLPFLLLLVSYLVIVMVPAVRQVWAPLHRLLLYTGLIPSFFVYAFLVILRGVKVRRLLSFFAIILCTTSLLFVSGRMSAPTSGLRRYLWSRAAIYVMMTGAVGVLFRHGFVAIAHQSRSGSKRDVPPVIGDSAESSYQKSGLPVAVMEKYYERLKDSMDKDQVFLDQELSLERLAARLKMPRHHLTQLLSVHLNSNFYQFVNSYRVNYACELIRTTGTGRSLEEIGLQSGFNSKTSFNRYFRTQTGLTPSEYRRKLNENGDA